MTEWAELSYTPGRWVAVSVPGQWLLVDLAAEDPVVRRCWKLMSESAGVDAVLDALLSGGVAMAPGFTLVSLRDGEQRAISRFPAVAVLHRAGAEAQEVAGVEGISWSDVLLGDADLDGITLRGLLSTDSTVELPMGAGVITAGVVHISAGSAPMPPPLPRPVPAPVPVEAEPPAAAAPEPPAPEPASPVSAAPAESAQPDEQPTYDFLFGATVRPEEAGRLSVSGDHPLPEEPPAIDAQPERPTREHAVVLEETLVPPATTTHDIPPGLTDEPGGLIDAVPWLDQRNEPPPVETIMQVAAQPTSVPSPPAEPVPDVSATVNRAALRAATAAAGPTVLAGYCPSRHLSPPHAARCRVCAAPMPQQAPFEIARPALGVLRLETGEVITLDRGVVLGRSPEAPEGEGAERPHVVRLASPENDISRTHAEIVLDGWNVYLRDFGSMNGTVVTLPGHPPERLREHNPQLLESGAVITLADEVSLTFEVTA